MNAEEIMKEEFGEGGLVMIGSHISKKMKSCMIAFAKYHCEQKVKAIENWLKSDEVFVTDLNGNVLKDVIIDCKPDSLKSFLAQ